MPPYESKRVAGVLGMYMLGVSIGAFIWALCLTEVGHTFPDYALGSELIYRLERGLAVTVVLALPILVVGPLLAGRVPSRLGKDGISWTQDREDVVAGLEDARKRLRTLETATRKLAGISNG